MRIKNYNGFTLIELMISIAILGTLSAIAVPNYIGYRQRAVNVRIISELKMIEKEIAAYQAETGAFPATLAQIGLGNLRDYWGNPYQYLPVAGTPRGQLRKDHFMVPVNTDFDLYSMGPDGRTVAPFTARHSRDDIVRANNGQYVGPVSGY
jgi:general secretion pathway protein G